MAGAYVVDDTAWQECKDGKRTGFSIMGVPKSKAGIFAGKSIADVACKRVLLRDLPDWTVTHVSLVDRPCVPKAEFLTIKARGFVSRLFSKKQASKEDDMKPEEIKQVVKEALDERAPDEALKTLDEKIEALDAKVEAMKAEPEPEPEAASKNEGDEDEHDVGALKTKIEELETENAAHKAFRADVEKKLGITSESKGLPAEPPATKSKPDYGSRDAAGRKVRD
jgi:polyhydroxyalkanoate synthesis regulator phasin